MPRKTKKASGAVSDVDASVPVVNDAVPQKKAVKNLRVKNADGRSKVKKDKDGATAIPIGIVRASESVKTEEKHEVSAPTPVAQAPHEDLPSETKPEALPHTPERSTTKKSARARKSGKATKSFLKKVGTIADGGKETALVATTPGALLPSPYQFEHRYGKVLWYAGVIHIVIGLFFAIPALSGLYVESIEFSFRDTTAPSRQMAAYITSDSLTTVSPSYVPSTDPVLTTTDSNGSGNGSDTLTTTNTSGDSGNDGTSSGDSSLNTTSSTSGTNDPASGDTSTSDTQTTTNQTSDTSSSSDLSATSGSGGTDTSATTAATETTTVRSTSEPLPTTNLTPQVSIMPSVGNPLSGKVPLAITVPGAEKVELMLLERGSLTARYIGSPVRLADGTWRYEWQTMQVPNGEYTLFAYVKNRYGSYRGGDRNVIIGNPIMTATSPTPVILEPAQVEEVENTIKTIEAELAPQQTTAALPPPSGTTAPAPATTASVPAGTSLSDMSVSIAPERDPYSSLASERAVQAEMVAFDAKLKILTERLSAALRTDDAQGISFVEGEIEKLRRTTMERLVALNALPAEKREAFEAELGKTLGEELEGIKKRERIIKERVGEKIFADSDKDGISDYDEANIYQTDPAVADSDNDGFIDGAEIIQGYDPKDDSREALIAFEDPKTNGPQRDDLLSVSEVKTYVPQAVPEGESENAQPPVAEFRGMALPNSFVTLYIFSQPVVVTVRTAEDGSWVYTFDKELEDGKHTMYVGITDNAGRIIAKSKPFPFVKTAEAFAGVEENAAVAAYEEPALISKSTFLLIVSLMVILMGVSLVALGAYFIHRQGYELIPQTA